MPNRVFVARPLHTVKPVVARGVQRLQQEDPVLAARRRLQELLAQSANRVLNAITAASSSLVSGIVLEAPTVLTRIVVETQLTPSTQTMKRRQNPTLQM